MATVNIANRLPIHVDVTPWWATNYSFPSTALPGSYSFSLYGDIKTDIAVSLTNETGEPPYSVVGYIQETKRTSTGVVSYSFESQAKSSNINTKIAELAPAATLKRRGTTYTLTSDSEQWQTVTLTSATGVTYTMAYWHICDGVDVMVNGVKVTSGTDADGNSITEASYLEEGQTWTMDLVDNLPDKTLLEAIKPYYTANGKHLIYDESNIMQAAYSVIASGHAAHTPVEVVADNVCAISYDYAYWGVGSTCACAEDIEVGAYMYPTRIGYVAYSEGWTDPLMGWKRVNGTDPQCVVSIGVNGMATTDNYLDDDGKPYTGLVYKTRPEPTQSIAFVEQFARMKTARTCTFRSVSDLQYWQQYCIGEYIGFITNKKKDGRWWTYEAEVYSPMDEEILTPTTLVYGFEGGTKALTMVGNTAGPTAQVVRSYAWLDSTRRRYDGITTAMGVTLEATTGIVYELNPVLLTGTSSSATGWQPDIATKTGDLENTIGVIYKAYGAELKFVDSGETTERTSDIVAYIPTFSWDRGKTIAGSVKLFTWYPTYYSTGWDFDSVRIEQGYMSGDIFRVSGYVKVDASECHSFALCFSEDEYSERETIPATTQYIAYDVYNIPTNQFEDGTRYLWRASFNKGPAWSSGKTMTLRMWQFHPLH